MKENNGNGYLFEVSWEVCNKVGGIYTVVTSKARQAVKTFGDQYILIGPDLKTNLDFEETDEEFWGEIREGTAIKDIPCRFGRWKIPGDPRVILVSFGKKYDKDQLLFQIWEAYGVDSIAGGWDYVEPVMFSWACGEVIETIYNLQIRTQGIPAVAQFHEWMCGAGLLYLKKNVPEIGTVFTTHATILGRSLAGAGVDIYSEMERISPQREASAHNISAKYSMEAASAREADCLTTVSEITATEVKNFLGRNPDIITPNGLDIETIPDCSWKREPAQNSRKRLLASAARFLGRDLPDKTKIISISGRYEYHNKGIDIFLDALGRMDKNMSGDQTILAWLFILGGHTDLIPSLQTDLVAKIESTSPHIATHRLQYESSDPILQACSRLGLKNMPQNRVQVIFIPAYLNGHDGLINMPYYDALCGCDLGVFPSYYEPWGYTPLESAAYAVPTITTDQAGFGLWVLHNIGETGGVLTISRKGQNQAAIEENLYQVFKDFLSWTETDTHTRREAARAVAMQAGWEEFFKSHLHAYDMARDVAGTRIEKLALPELRVETRKIYTGAVSTQPHFRSFTAVSNLPPGISRLRDLAYNLWWSWNPRTLDIFALLDTKIWPEMQSNPVRMLETVSSEQVAGVAANDSYLELYNKVINQFDAYMENRSPTSKITNGGEIKWTSPVAYFCTEYGIHESLPIYSGGLGTLAGDHLKTASDSNLPLVGIGLLYKNGYFQQVIDKNGIQMAEYPENDFSRMPVKIVQDDRGNEVQISIELPGRTLYATIWEVRIGRVSLYLLNSDVPQNTMQDRKITSCLYCSDQRTRIEQEILLGMGGIKVLKKLGIRPSIYHINEGHSAFLVFQRMLDLMSEEGLSIDEAMEAIHGSTIFTTHTPVEAGNERFSRDLMEHYFTGFIKRSGMTWSRFWELGRRDGGDDKTFFMNILAFRMSRDSNAVSQIHGQVSRRMWRDVWKGFHDSDIPIRSITNGVHISSWIAPRMKELLDGYLGVDWEHQAADSERWSRIQDIPDTLLWRVRYEIKQRLTNLLREYIVRHWEKFNYTKTWREDLYAKINPAAMTIGFARRFAPYKRADILLYDLDRLDRILNHPSRPVRIIYAGKAHPNDDMGKSLVKKVIDICRDERFQGKIFFLENYDIRLARHLVRGVDVWLNTPRRPLEASGTSGIKAVANGVLHLSTSDGWWPEAYDGTNGWVIGPLVRGLSEEAPQADLEDSESLYSLLENTVIPTFYDREISGLPEKWLAMIKRSMKTLIPAFSTQRMLNQYATEMYFPTARRERDLSGDNYSLARYLADWKGKIPMRFSSLRLLDVTVEGIHGDTIEVNEPLIIQACLDPGKLEEKDILVEMLVGQRDSMGLVKDPVYIPLKMANKKTDGSLTYETEYRVPANGSYGFGVRVMPVNPKLSGKKETGLVLWW